MKRKPQKEDEQDTPETSTFKRPKVTDVKTYKSESRWVQSHVAKAGKPKGNKGKRSAGKLKRLTELPLDIVFEIVSKLEPIDLLQLIRVSRNFRTMFMSKHLWVAARGNIPRIPDCPPDLNEAQYASLIFERKCQACGSTCKAESVDYALRIRACVRCFNQLTGKGSVIVNKIVDYKKKSKKVQHNIFSLVPYSLWHNWHRGDEDDFQFSPTYKYYAAELRAVVEEYLSIQSQGDKENLDKFVKERQELAKQMLESGKAISMWIAWRNTERINEDAEIENKRKAEIHAKLFELGYTEKDFPRMQDYSYNSAWGKIVYQPKPMTSKNWKVVQPKLVQILVDVKAARQERMHRINKTRRMPSLQKLWPDFVRAHVTGPGCLLPIDYVSEHCKSVIHLLEVIKEIADVSTPAKYAEEDDVKMSDLVSSADLIQHELEQAYNDARASFFEQLPEGCDESMLEDPTTLFRCINCKTSYHSLLSFKAALGHTCDGGGSLYSYSLPFSLSTFRLESGARSTAAELLKMLHLDKTTNTQELSGRLKCICSHPSVCNGTLTFESLVSHIYFETEWYELAKLAKPTSDEYELHNDHTLEQLPNLVRLLPPEEVSTPVVADLRPHISTYASDHCVPCQALGQGYNECRMGRMEAWRAYHLKAKHGLEDKKEYYVNPWLDGDLYTRGLY